MKTFLLKMRRYAPFLLALLAVASLGAFSVFAATGVNTPESSSIDNPIKAKTFTQLLALILDIIIDVGLPIIIIMIIFVGFQYVLAQGNATKLAKAHDAFLWVMVGAAIVIGAKVIVAIVTNTVSQISN